MDGFAHDHSPKEWPTSYIRFPNYLKFRYSFVGASERDPAMKRDNRTRRREGRRAESVKLDEVARVACSTSTRAGETREVPAIVLRGDWLKALGFPIGAPIYVFAEAHGRMAICRMGLAKPRWVRIVAPASDKSTR
jgi:hypothetical protein